MRAEYCALERLPYTTAHGESVPYHLSYRAIQTASLLDKEDGLRENGSLEWSTVRS